jgi:DNA-binding PadR family transcriptional regulator
MNDCYQRLTPLGIAVLGLLRERPMHPYEMHQLLLERHLDEFVKVKPGTLYHTVDRLLGNELIEQVGTECQGNRPERTTYRVTALGHDAVNCWVRDKLEAPDEEFAQFPYALTEAHNIPASEAVTALTGRCSALRTRIRNLEEHVSAPSDKETVYRLGGLHLVAMLKAELSWTSDLIERIENKEFAWQPHHP